MAKPLSRLYYLDALRGTAAIAVVLFHYQRYFCPQRFMDYGYLAVDLFFMLSGIVLQQGYGKALEGGMSCAHFLRKRLERLYPMVLIASIVTLALDFAAVSPTNFSSNSPLDVVRNVVLVPAWSGGSAFPANGPMWSLFCEVVVNLAWFFTARLFTARGQRFLLLAAGALTLGLAVKHHTLDYGWSGGLSVVEGCVRATFGFFLGIALAKGASRRSRWLTGAPRILLLSVAVCLLAVRLAAGAFLVPEFCGYLGLVGLLAAIQAQRPPSQWLPLCGWLGNVSYPLYLLHGPYGRLFVGSVPSLATGMIFLSTLLFAAWLIHRYVERPAHAWLRRA